MTNLIQLPQAPFAMPTAGYGKARVDFFAPPVQSGPDLLHSLPNTRYMGSLFAMLIGRRGAGKSALLAAVAREVHRKYVAKKTRHHVFTNMNLRFLRRHDPATDPEITYQSNALLDANGNPLDYYNSELINAISMYPPWLRDGYLVVDEIQSNAMGRRASSKANVNIATFLTQVRKRDIEGIFTTQFPQILDYYVLLQTDLFIEVHPVGGVGRWPSKDPTLPGVPKMLEAYIYDYWGQYTGRNHRKIWPPQAEDVDKVRIFVIPESVGSIYNTKQLQSSSYWDDEIRFSLSAQQDAMMVDDGFEGMSAAIAKAQDELEHDPGIRFVDIDDWKSRLPDMFNITHKLSEAQSISNGMIHTKEHLADWLANEGFVISEKAYGKGKAIYAMRGEAA